MEEVNAVTGGRITQKAAAEALGVSSPYLSKLRKQGKIAPEPDGLWDLDKLREQIDRSRDVGQSMAAETRRRGREEGDVPAEQDPPADDDGALDEEPEYGPDYVENYKIALSFEKRENARQARIDRMKKEESLALVVDVHRERFTEARMIRDTLMGAFPTKVAPALALITDAFELERVLRNALREAIVDLVGDVRAVR